MVRVRSPDAMTSLQLPVQRLTADSVHGQKTHLRLKLLLLENAQRKFKEELRNFTKKAYEEVQDFFSSSCPTGVLSDLIKALDAKCQAINKLSALLQDLTEDAVDRPPAIIQTAEMNAERPPPALPHTQAVFPEISNPKPMKITPLISQGCDDGVQVQQQKQTIPQLLHALRFESMNWGSPEATVMESNNNTSMSSSPRSASPTVKTQSHQFRQGGTDGLSYPEAAGTENQSQVFKVKREDSKRSLTYTSAIAETELWEIDHIFTKGKLDSNANLVVNKDSLQCPKPEDEGTSAGVKTPLISSIAIPQFQIRKFEEIEVVVSHIVSPDDFYVQRADAIGEFQSLFMDSWEASSSYAEQNCIPDIGTLVMGWFSKQEQWCRAQVTKICGVSADKNAINGVEGKIKPTEVEVKRLDHGDTVCLPLWGVKELTPEMAALPLQAIQVSVANVTPVNGSDWSEEAVSWFKATVYRRTFYARLYPQGPKVTVELFFEKGRLGAMRRSPPVSVRLEQSGHAKQISLRNGGLWK